MAFESIVWENGKTHAISAENLNRIEKGISNSLQLDGGTMTGSLILKGSPTEDNEAATKEYCDNNIIYINVKTTKTGDHIFYTNQNFSPDKYILARVGYTSSSECVGSFTIHQFGKDILVNNTKGMASVHCKVNTDGTVTMDGKGSIDLILFPAKKYYFPQ